jgi:mRNA-degrading endonuclease toxin of MazEF toxin-antitoxin module
MGRISATSFTQFHFFQKSWIDTMRLDHVVSCEENSINFAIPVSSEALLERYGRCYVVSLCSSPKLLCSIP